MRVEPARHAQQVDRLRLVMEFGALTITPVSGAAATWDRVQNQGSGALVTGPLAFSLGDPAGTAVPGSVALTRLEHGLENLLALGSSSGGAGSGKANFEPTTLYGASLGALSAQWLYHAGLGAVLPESETPAPLTIHVVDAADGHVLAMLEHTCLVVPYRLHLWSDDDGQLRQALGFVYGAMRVTEYDWSGGSPPTSASWTWSQVLNQPLPTCE
jgi:hypothetical protein